jgi:uncharacterized lipoprotein YmbA
MTKEEVTMKNRFYPTLPLILLGAFLLAHFGCASSPTPRFYILSPLTISGSELKPPADERCLSIGIGPIKIPRYLDQAQIVTRSTANELVLAEFDLWAEPLNENFTRVLSQNLSNLLCTKTVVVFPWRGTIPVDYRIEADVLRFDGILGGHVSLEVWWRVFSGDGKRMLLAMKSNLNEPAGGIDYQSLVSAQGRTIEKLSHEMVKAIKNLPK